MYLEKLELQGFKSFANKNKLNFPGMIGDEKRGITAIVGPNGSGKSNIADAIRWVLGEQSIKILRGKKSEDVIFSGSNKKTKLGMAEVSLFLNNEDKSRIRISKEEEKDSPLNFSNIQITRRIYRGGDSEYIINGSRVRLIDVQILLAKAKFGQKTYSVIGQGMVENFLNTSISERKSFFDEATGVKQFQLKRDSSLNKLESSHENLSQVDMLLQEIEPRLKSLTRQVSKLQKREELEKELQTLQHQYYRTKWHDINDKLSKVNAEFLELDKTKIEKEKKSKNINKELEKLGNNNNFTELNNLQRELEELQSEKEKLTKQLARLDAELESNLESHGQFDLAWLNNKKEQLTSELNKASQEIKNTNTVGIDNINQREEAELKEVNKKIDELNKYLVKLTSTQVHNEEKDKVKEIIKNFLKELDEISEEEDINKLKQLIKQAKASFKEKIKSFIEENSDQNTETNNELQKDIEKTQTEIIELSEERQEISNRINENNLKVSSEKERIKLLKEKEQQLEEEIEDINLKLQKGDVKFDDAKINEEKTSLKDKAEDFDKKINEKRQSINKINSDKEEEKMHLFNLQKNIQNSQNEINSLTSQLNDLKINATRQETKLEALETSIRNDKISLTEIRNTRVKEDIDVDAHWNKMMSMKHQLELIGGIDPETEKEYNETKERYDFLFSQTTDLQGAIKSLEKVVYELDSTIKQQFDREFKIISDKFSEYFKILFNGGDAKIFKVMTEEEIPEAEKEDDDELKKIKFLKKHNATGLSGVDVQATPPGKKIKSINMLSGGEKALTAIALICAIISVNPSPFVVLDEVDAALDEANSERLAKILDDLSHKTQFIIITHNRASMKKANVLYGITMGDEGVSKLLSINLDQVKGKDAA